ncbi:MAG: sensor histidine kinase, partial [Dehalococcoidia bacterium]
MAISSKVSRQPIAAGRSLSRRTLRALGITALASAVLMFVSLAVAVHMGAGDHDVTILGLTLLVSGLGSLILALVLLRVAERSPRIGITARLVIPTGLAIAVMLLNVWFTASLMFISHHDVVVLAALLSYAGVLALVAAAMVAGSITSGLSRLIDAVGHMAGGQTGVRVEVRTADEVGALGHAFNLMAERLETASELQREMDEARRTLLAAVSHDLRTPLAAIRVMLEAIEDGVVEDTQTIDRYHRSMQGEVERLSRLIDDLFELSQIEAGALRLNFDRTDLAELIAETVEAMQAEAGKASVELSVAGASGPLDVTADSQKLHRVLSNLAGNALRHTPPGGAVRVSAAQHDGMVTVMVADTGEGIAAEDLPHVFERFYRGDK